MTEGRAQRMPTPPTMHNSRLLHRLDLRDGPLAGRARRRAGRQPVRGIPGRLRCWSTARRCAACAPRPRGSIARGQPGLGLHGADRPDGPDHRRGRRHPRRAGPGVAGVAAGRLAPTRSSSRSGVKEMWEVKRPLDAVIHTLGWPLADRRLRRELLLSARADPGGARPGGRARLSRRQPRRARAAAAAQAASAVPAASRRRPAARVGRQDDSRGRLLRAARAARAATACCSWATRSASWTCLRSRASTTRCSRACTRRGPPSRRSRAATCPPPALAAYDRMVDESYIVADMRRTRNMRLAFKDGLYVGGVKAGAHDRDRGPLPGRPDRRWPRTRGRRAPRRRRAVRARRRRSRSASWTRSSSRGTRPATPSRRTCIVGQDVSGRGGRLLLPRLSGRGLRAGGRRAPGQRPPTASTARPPTCWVRAGRLARAGAGRSIERCEHTDRVQLA